MEREKGQAAHVSSGSPYESRYGFSRAIRVGKAIEIAGTAPIGADGSCEADPYLQARRCLQIIVDALDELGATPQDVVRTRMYVTSPDIADEVGRAHEEVFGHVRPASTMVVVAALLDTRWLVEIEVSALVQD